MTGLSLRCGDCGVQLRNVEEAQAHAEATSHTNFAESTEAVLNLVCSDCGKPCRSQTIRSHFPLFLSRSDLLDASWSVLHPDLVIDLVVHRRWTCTPSARVTRVHGQDHGSRQAHRSRGAAEAGLGGHGLGRIRKWGAARDGGAGGKQGDACRPLSHGVFDGACH